MTLDVPFLFLAAAAGTAEAAAAATDEAATYADPNALSLPLYIVVMLGLASICAGMVLCLYRLWKGPGLADRVLASDVFAFHVVALVILLSVYLRNLTFFDAALGVALVGFASTVGFAQFIGARQKGSAASAAPPPPAASPPDGDTPR